MSADGSSGAVGGGVGGMSAAWLAASPESICASIISSADIDSCSEKCSRCSRSPSESSAAAASSEGRMFFQTIRWFGRNDSSSMVSPIIAPAVGENSGKRVGGGDAEEKLVAEESQRSSRSAKSEREVCH